MLGETRKPILPHPRSAQYGRTRKKQFLISKVAQHDLKLRHDFLRNLNEKLNGWIKLRATEGDVVIHTQAEPITLLAYNEWCGLQSLPEILAAFVLPNDSTINTVLDKAATLLREDTGQSAFNGYQDKNRKRVWKQVAAIYRAKHRLGRKAAPQVRWFEASIQPAAASTATGLPHCHRKGQLFGVAPGFGRTGVARRRRQRWVCIGFVPLRLSGDDLAHGLVEAQAQDLDKGQWCCQLGHAGASANGTQRFIREGTLSEAGFLRFQEASEWREPGAGSPFQGGQTGPGGVCRVRLRNRLGEERRSRPLKGLSLPTSASASECQS